ncbi:Yip1 family protein [Streptomyces sp. NPDC052396]|uniref:Yip1 family protein n=1 Tax=Streptomyces sp. NPDC052396 TaxID=3365689 RepID=UPI0037CF15C5
MAGFRMGRGGDSNEPGPARQGQHPGYPGQQQAAPYGGGQQWQRPGGHDDEPEYFGGGQQPQYGQQHGQQYAAPYDPYATRPGEHPGQTQQFSLGEAPDAYPPPGASDPYGAPSTYGGDPGQAAAPAGPPPGPRLHWKELLSGIVLRPSATFWRMRDHAMWGPALIVTFVYGLLAVFGFDKARKDVLHATLASAVPLVLTAGAIVLISGLILGVVTHTMARQLGGDGLWQPTVGLSMLIMSITDAPRLVFAMFLGGDSPFVQLLGWATWVLAGVLFTSMVSKSHDIPWPKALAASAIQLIALLSIIKLGTL